MQRVQFVNVVPTLKDRRNEAIGSATYSTARMPGLRRLMAAPVPAGAFPFGHEPEHRKSDGENQ